MLLRNRKLAIFVALAFLAAAVVSGALLWSYRGADLHEHAAAGEVIYYCPMHPTVTSDSPGNCPICGMSLIRRVTVDPAAAQLADAGAIAEVALSPSQQVLANVATVPATVRPWEGGLVATGVVTYDETRLAQVTSYTGGRIERLFVQFTGDSVRRGQPVAQIYSPELYASQQEYLLAIANLERMRSTGFAGARSAAADLVESSGRRLQLFGMTDHQIAELAQTGKPFYTTTVHAPVGGIVVRRNVVPQQYVQAGEPLLELADLSRVWVEADVYEKDLARIAVGQEVAVTTRAYPGVAWSGTVAFIEPLVSGATRSNRVRIELPNPDLRLKPGMYASVQFESAADRGSALMVPKTALVDRGLERFVWVETAPGRYAPRRVTTGGEAGGYVAILTGLREGERVVVHGGFLLDSEAQLRQTAGGGAANDSHDH